ncbi:AN1-type zinc finger domain-containing protein [Comamonas antarctica]|uniref:AN1-type zinc finger domain-containing protein n=1 Tax=Comamonas antarctica TaxID=2743470 RepID=UPI0028E7E227|nr:AN1-type zinc finger domain-containing protein [Comamonas antarctica]
MSYAIGWDSDNYRWKGYGVPCACEHPECAEEVDRGMSYECEGCGLSFCAKHRIGQVCERCQDIDDVGDRPEGVEPFPAKPESLEWLQHLRTHESWANWRGTPGSLEQWERWHHEAQKGHQ